MSIRVISPNLPNGSPDNHVRLKLDVTQRGQTVFAIGRPIRSDYNYFLFLNGVQQTQGVDYTVSDVALTWSGRKLWLTDILEFYFYVEDSVETTLPTNDYTPPPDQEEDTPSTPSDPLPDVEPPPVTPPTSSKSIIGINLCDVADYSPALPFVNLMKFAREWTPCTATKWNTGDTLELDNNGYVKRIPTGAAYTLVSTVVCTSQNEYLAGKYHVLYDGDGKLEYKRDAVKNTSLSVPGHDVINVNPARGIQLNITYINPNNYIRNIRIVHENYLNNYQTQIFNPTYLERLAPFGTIRFMNWMSTNGSMQTGWDTRKTPDHATWAGYTPVEIMVEFCNRLNVDPWFNMPHMCLDDYVYSFASYVKDHLNPDLHVYVEYTNEAWNFSPAFWQSRWIVSRSAEDFPDFAGGNNLRAINWFSRRTTQICQIWDEVYGDDKAKVIGVMGAWAANYDRADKLLRYGWTNNPLTHQEYGIDAIAIAPYFGGHLERLYSDVIQSWIANYGQAGALDKLFLEITEGGQTDYLISALQKSYENIVKNKKVADDNGLRLLSYEGGQHLVPPPQIADIDMLFRTANRDLRMGAAVKQYLQQWKETVNDVFCYFSDITPYTKYGSWGLLERLSQTSTSKYNAVVEFVEENLL